MHINFMFVEMKSWSRGEAAAAADTTGLGGAVPTARTEARTS